MDNNTIITDVERERALKEYEELNTPESPYQKGKPHTTPTCPYCNSTRYLYNSDGIPNMKCGFCGKSLKWS